MKNIRHQEVSRDSLFKDLEMNLETIYGLWANGDNSLRFSIPILCAAKLEAFINVAGKLKVEHWDIFERKLSFAEKCKVACSVVHLAFDPNVEPNKAAIATFEIRNSLVHPKMKLSRIDERVTSEEYERRRTQLDPRFSHHLRSELTNERVAAIKTNSDTFVVHWGKKLLDDHPDYWLAGGSTGGFTFEKPIAQP